MNTNTDNNSEQVPAMVKLPIAIFSICVGGVAIFGAGLSFLKSATPAAEAGNYTLMSASVLGVIAATLGTSVLAKAVNDWLVKQVAKAW
jgi:Ca2+/Na+ antiporter